jgi:hypothetical protein
MTRGFVNRQDRFCEFLRAELSGVLFASRSFQQVIHKKRGQASGLLFMDFPPSIACFGAMIHGIGRAPEAVEGVPLNPP